MKRPLMLKSIVELELMAERNRSDSAELLLILQELAFRSTTRATALKQEIEKTMQDYQQPAESADTDESKPASTREDTTLGAQARQDTFLAVAKLRAKLIDLSRKSPLINFRHGGRSASILRIVDERPDLVFQSLHQGGMQFEALPAPETTPLDETTDEFRIAYERGRLTDSDFLKATEELGDKEEDSAALQIAERILRAKVRRELGLPELDYGKALDVAALALANGFDPSFDLRSSDEATEDHHEDNWLRVLLTEKELQKRLKSIWDKYRSHYRETGIHTLYLAIGFVEWIEEANNTKNHAPVLLLAVELGREIKRSRYEYTLRPHDEGLQINIALAEKMREHWHLEMPELREDETPESYFVRLRSVLEAGRDLKLRQFVTLAVLPFPQMILWKDLDPDRWDDDAFADHRLLPALMGTAPMGGEHSPFEPYDIESPEWRGRVPALVRPADASQHSALIEVAEGSDLALEGPPGTGKSETITNMIADAVSRGQRVLFVAEKQAALQVVANRLKATGLGALTLELHGENANRTEVYAGLRERLRTKADADLRYLNLQRGRLVEKRELLRNYLAHLREPIGSLERTAYALVWREIHLRSKVEGSLQGDLASLITISDPTTVSEAQLSSVRTQLDIFGQAIRAISSDPKTLWLHARSLPVFDQNAQLKAAEAAAEAAERVTRETEALRGLAPLELPYPYDEPSDAMEQLSSLTPLENVSEAAARSALRDAERSRTLMRLQTRWRLLSDKLGDDVDSPQDCDRGAVERLAALLVDFGNLPGTVAQSRGEMRDHIDLTAEVERGSTELTALGAILPISEAVTLATLNVAMSVLDELDSHPASVRALLRADLLDPVIELTIEEQSNQAELLRTERRGLQSSVNDEALETDPTELTQLADTLEDSGFFTRLFSKEYKQANRRTARLLRDTAERLENAKLLRETARLGRSVSQFRSESAVRTLFPEVLWKGLDSDFADLEKARATLLSARLRLGEVGEGDLLQSWLHLGSDQRSRVGELARQLVPTLRALERSVGSAASFSEAQATLLARRENLIKLNSALDSIGASETGSILRDGEDIASRISTMDSCQNEFDQLISNGAFSWAGSIEQPLDELSRALQHVDAMKQHEDILAILPALAKSETPVELLSKIAARGVTYVKAVADWTGAAEHLHGESGLSLGSLSQDRSADIVDGWRLAADKLTALGADHAGIREAANLLKYQSELSEIGLAGLVERTIAGEIDTEQLSNTYELQLVSLLLRKYLSGDGEALQRAGGLNLADARSQFAKIDEQLHHLEAEAILAERLTDKPPAGVGHGRRSEFTEASLLENELSLKRPRTPLRDVVHRAGEAMQTLKPIWMMSPSSAAQYIRPDAVKFDLLIVDEASQMRPEYALSALLRSNQFVVVGDANQLPPSDHFGAATPDNVDDDGIGVDADAESILDVANQKFRRKRRLKWHYRSRHESLIQFSNREFYDEDLVVFPSPSGSGDDVLGVKCYYVPDLHEDTFYEASINQREAEAVLAEALRLMSAYPEHSLGIAAMNAKQTELLQNEFDRLRLEHKEIDRYVDAFSDTVDEFFIKNLENVQGDERDIIIVSTVYGPDQSGVVKQNFGLMNREVGWRRLNVLVTRAKLSIRVFTSLRPGDVKVTPASSKGIRAFHAYLAYIHGAPTVDEESVGEADNDFEWMVAERLRNEGYECVTQVGVNNFRIDIGVRHPDHEGTFIAGIECDGAPYHSGFTVRDRDRIRQQVLEGLNWRIYRVWSVDWYQNPDQEIAKLTGWLAKIREGLAAQKSEILLSHSERVEKAEKENQPVSSQAKPEEEAHPEGAGGDAAAVSEEGNAEPIGRAMRPLGDFDWYEVVRGQRYSVWIRGVFVGEVSVLSRGLDAPRLYGSQVQVPRSEYEGWIEETAASSKFNDLYAAVRWVAAGAK